MAAEDTDAVRAGRDLDAAVQEIRYQAEQTAALSGDIADAEELLAAVRDALTELRAVEGDLETHITGKLGPGTHTAGDVAVKVYPGPSKKQWKSEGLFAHLVQRARVTADGEPRDLETSFRLLVSELRTVLPLTDTLGWRIDALKQVGIDPDKQGWLARKGGALKVERLPALPSANDDSAGTDGSEA